MVDTDEVDNRDQGFRKQMMISSLSSFAVKISTGSCNTCRIVKFICAYNLPTLSKAEHGSYFLSTILFSRGEKRKRREIKESIQVSMR